ncbi:MAG: hypothetical protein SCARUB_01615 [Candidatus Scalindua rubra]|uniref:Uncharacterized protein n=1 Tax=Candidatus Scalindua rubra TaxID=1872076 RepID=A0A1E3XE54_9BACT|nr:MAG: hypothetical protein SCARUB_01615 [Candidatus Scalindua rubra]
MNLKYEEIKEAEYKTHENMLKGMNLLTMVLIYGIDNHTPAKLAIIYSIFLGGVSC